jgi:hypothetical protein
MDSITVPSLQNNTVQGASDEQIVDYGVSNGISLNTVLHLPVIWSASPSGTKAVNTIVTPSWIYAGTNGAVYRLDKSKGLIQKTQGLSGYGYHPVSLAASSDGKVLVIGIYKYVVRLDPVSLEPVWSDPFKTDDFAGDVSVILDEKNQRIYAGTAGAVFSLNMDGNKIGRQAITAGGNESRIALDPSGSFIALGTSGYAAVYNAPNLENKLWSKKFDKAVGPTTVLCNATTVYIADSGYIWDRWVRGDTSCTRRREQPFVRRHQRLRWAVRCYHAR